MDENFAINRFLPMAFGLYFADSFVPSNNPPVLRRYLITNDGKFLLTNDMKFLQTNT